MTYFTKLYYIFISCISIQEWTVVNEEQMKVETVQLKNMKIYKFVFDKNKQDYQLEALVSLNRWPEQTYI